jgi:excisionase family DNA binding protein
MEERAVLEPLLLRVEEAARLANIGRSLAYEKVARKEWPSISVGRCRRVPLEGLKQWIEAELAKSA